MTVVGGGLAGSECALQLAKRGVHVRLFEQRPDGYAPAHHTDGLAELVCSNSLKSDDPKTAAGVLKRELEAMGSALISCAREAAVPAGGALAVDRVRFSQLVTSQIEDSANIELVREEVVSVPEGPCVIAAGPLCSPSLAGALHERLGGESLAFFDAAAPIVSADSLDFDIVFSQSRYDKGSGADYLNCPLNHDEYERLVFELTHARRTIDHDFEQRDLFCACQPVEEVARLGQDTLRFGALKPVGLRDPRTGERPYAAVQLRAETATHASFNLVGFQTNLTWPEQKRVFSLIPGLGNAEFLRYGVMHRNTFVDSPRVLDGSFAIPDTQIRLAGQISGTEGYVEAMASGLFAALNTFAELSGLAYPKLPPTGAFGSLVAYATNPDTYPYQPQHVNYGLFPELTRYIRNKGERRAALAARALEDTRAFVAERKDLFGDRA